MWSTRSVAVLTFFVMIVLRRHVALSWDVVDPASNYLGWYMWSLVVTTLSWQWWVALLLRGREGRARTPFLFMAALVIAENMIYPERGWTHLVYGTSISPEAHQVLYVVDVVFDLLSGVLLALVAIMSTQHPYRLLFVVSVLALKVFANEVVPAGLHPIEAEIITSVTILGLYVAAMTLTLIPGTSPLRESLRTQ